MDPKNASIITEDGRRLSIEEGEITGTEDTGPGLAYELDNKMDEPQANDEQEQQRDQPGE
ncbi:MAG TPA: hypothetical protein VM935_12675 [Chitinophagaceae bacterium]|nr:hypothetical protein [Chitinophagaceae bacterium]